MSENHAERRLVENELIFRQMNQRIVEDLTNLTDLAVEHNQADLAPDKSRTLHFYCECSNINCIERIIVSPEEYERIHFHSRRFMTVKGHLTPEIERVVDTTPNYDIIEKFREPSQVLSE